MQEIMYHYSSILIVGLLLLALLAAIEAGFRLGGKASPNADEALKGQVNTIQASLLGLLALLLRFIFSQALQRYDTRSAAVVAEANAIGTCPRSFCFCCSVPFFSRHAWCVPPKETGVVRPIAIAIGDGAA